MLREVGFPRFRPGLVIAEWSAIKAAACPTPIGRLLPRNVRTQSDSWYGKITKGIAQQRIIDMPRVVGRDVVGLSHQLDDRDDALSRALVVAELRFEGGLLCVDVIAFSSVKRARCCRECLGAEFDSDVRLGHEVAVPVGVPIGSTFAGEDEDPAVVQQRDQWRYALGSGLGADVVQQDQRFA